MRVYTHFCVQRCPNTTSLCCRPPTHCLAVAVTFTVDKIMQPSPRKIKRIDAHFTITGCSRQAQAQAHRQVLTSSAAAPAPLPPPLTF